MYYSYLFQKNLYNKDSLIKIYRDTKVNKILIYTCTYFNINYRVYFWYL